MTVYLLRGDTQKEEREKEWCNGRSNWQKDKLSLLLCQKCGIQKDKERENGTYTSSISVPLLLPITTHILSVNYIGSYDILPNFILVRPNSSLIAKHFERSSKLSFVLVYILKWFIDSIETYNKRQKREREKNMKNSALSRLSNGYTRPTGPTGMRALAASHTTMRAVVVYAPGFLSHRVTQYVDIPFLYTCPLVHGQPFVTIWTWPSRGISGQWKNFSLSHSIDKEKRGERGLKNRKGFCE